MLNKAINDLGLDTQKTKVLNVCKTRWLERIDGLDRFFDLFVPLYNCFEGMSLDVDGNCNEKTRTGGAHFFNLMGNFRFIVSLVFTKNLLDRCEPATRALQSSTMDILAAVETISSLCSVAQDLRKNADDIHTEWYQQSLDLASKCEIDEWKPRTSSIQKSRNNVPADTISGYYKRSLTIPLFDKFVADIDMRFGDTAITAYQGLAILPSRVVSKDSFKSLLTWEKQFLAFANAYQTDLPFFERIEGEIEAWQSDWKSSKIEPPKSLSQTLQLIDFPGYENIKEALKILATLPITSCECERSFSSLRLLKTFNRTTMGDERLDELALVYIHQDREPDLQRISQKFFSMKNRRNDLIKH